jgi:predicted RecA/RadA family phage recombinase
MNPNKRGNRCRSRRGLVVGGWLFVAVGTFAAGSAEATGTQGVAAMPGPAAAPGAAQGFKVYKDPVTGEFTAPPSEQATPSLKVPAAPTAEGLVEQPSPVPGGGVSLDLEGRFESVVTATKAPDGTLSTQCELKPAADRDPPAQGAASARQP